MKGMSPDRPREFTTQEGAMATGRRTMAQLRKEKVQEQLAEMNDAIAEGRLTVRQMTAKERRASDQRRAARRPVTKAFSMR